MIGMKGKINAARLALSLVQDGMILGIGSGTTVEIFLELLGERIKKEELEIYGVPSSYQSHISALKNGVKVVDLFAYSDLDLCIDGADQVDAMLNCIKGGGAALTREKIVASASRRVVIIVDESKLSEKLNIAVPVEVLPFACGFVMRRLNEIASEVKLRESEGKVGPLVTDNGNFILDCYFGEIKKPEELEETINSIPGVVENGIFPSHLIDSVIVGNEKTADYKN
jgi:ribose 5-phosphate isomerase A